MKKFMNEPDTLVAESLEGLVRAHEAILDFGRDRRFVRRKQLVAGKVAIVSGGGADFKEEVEEGGLGELGSASEAAVVAVEGLEELGRGLRDLVRADADGVGGGGEVLSDSVGEFLGLLVDFVAALLPGAGDAFDDLGERGDAEAGAGLRGEVGAAPEGA